MLCGCAASPDRGAPPLAVKTPTTCERLLVAPALPKVTADDDARVAFMKDDAALIIARKRIVAGRRCAADLRKAYATGGK